jgi:8-oxo-dGTP pyrophosphatase MutT (NUDIX family)
MLKASVMIIEKNGLFLAITRGHESEQIGFPGGKSEEGESTKETAIRECFEETGFLVSDCSELFTDVVNGDTKFETTCFIANKFSGALKESEEGKVFWAQKELFLTNSPFASYNKKVFDFLNV